MADPAVVGAFTLFGVALGGALNLLLSNLQFERQRRLAREEHERRTRAELNRALSEKLDKNFRHAEALIFGATQMWNSLESMSTQERHEFFRRVLEQHGLPELGVYAPPGLFTDDALKKEVETHWSAMMMMQLGLTQLAIPLAEYGTRFKSDVEKIEAAKSAARTRVQELQMLDRLL